MAGLGLFEVFEVFELFEGLYGVVEQVAGTIDLEPKLGLLEGVALEEPLAVNELVDEGAGLGGCGPEAIVVRGGEPLEVGGLLGGEEADLAVDAGFGGVRGGGGLACNRGGASGFLCGATVGFSSSLRGHGLARTMRLAGGSACPTSRISRPSGGLGGEDS